MSDHKKRCLYEVLGVSKDCTQEEIRSSYRKLALQLHPDKLIKTGVSEEQATAAFQELVNAYEVLSDPKERSWYDSHRSQILLSDPSTTKPSSDFIDSDSLFQFFSNSVFSGYSDTGKGFYKVYSDVFGRIYAQEVLFAKKFGLGMDSVREAPLMGTLDSPYSQVTAFNGYWLGFCTVMDFSWADMYHASAGPNRKSRRVMEEENKKARKKAKREYNDTVRGLAEFVKKRDKRVVEMQLKRNLEEERRREEEKRRKKEEARAKLEKARLYEEPEWARVEEEEDVFEEFEDGGKKGEKELYCVVCGKKFKSEKQWKNHEQSKKHRDKVAELRDTFKAEDKEKVADDIDEINVGSGHSVSVADNLDSLCNEFEDGLVLQEEHGKNRTSDDDNDEGIEAFQTKNQNLFNELDGSDDEASILEAMGSGHKSRKNTAERQSEASSSKGKGDNSDEMSFTEYDTWKTKRLNRTSKREQSVKSNADTTRAENDVPLKEIISNCNGGEVQVDEDTAQDIPHLKAKETSTKNLEKNRKAKNQSLDRKVAGRETNGKLKKSSTGKKQKATSKAPGLSCETCGESFESRNKMFMHLGDTGHAKLKS